jgi:ubiquinone/menaquinone biosynthesis C-methylase UbiE
MALFLVLQIVVRLVRKIYPFPIPAAMIRLIDNPLRRRFFSAGKTLDLVGIRPGMEVLELGPGSGFFTLEAARRLGPTGKLYSVDIEPQAIAILKQKTQNLTNVETRVGEAHGLDFPAESLDLAFLVAILGEIPGPVRALREIHRVLKADGTLSITEMLPDPDYPLRRTVVRWCREAGFELVEKHGNFFCYTLNFRKAKGVG